MKISYPVLIFIFLLSATLMAVNTRPSSGNSGEIKKKAKFDPRTVKSLTNKGFFYLSRSANNPVKARQCLDSALLICGKYKAEIPEEVHLLNAEITFMSGDYFKSEEEGKIAMKKAKESGNNNVLVRAMMIMANNYGHTGFVREGMDYLDKALGLANQEKLKGLIPRIYLLKADIYGDAGNFNERKENLKFMISASREENDTVALMAGLSQLGTALEDTIQYLYGNLRNSPYTKVMDLKRSRSLLKECLMISRKAEDGYYLAYSSANLGYNYYLNKEYDSSIYYYKMSIGFTPPSMRGSRANALGNLGTIYRDLGNYRLALQYYDSSLKDAKPNDFYNISWVYNDMTGLYLARKDTGNAFRSYSLFKRFNDSLLITRNSANLTEARIQYEFDTHSKEVDLLSLRLKNNRILNISLAGFIFLAVAIAGLLLRNSNIQAKRRISEMNHRISEITQANLRQQMNPHFIFNTLNSIQYFMYQNDKLATNNYLTKFSTLMRKVLENSQHTSIPLSDELEALRLYLDLECLRFRDKFDYRINVDEEIDPLLFKVPTMLIQPYVENSILHGLVAKEGKGTVKIDLKLGIEKITCIIEDNGIGREAASARKNDREINHNSYGTRIVSSRLDLVNELYGTDLKTTYEDLKNDKGESVGTKVEIHIPIMT